MSEKKKISIDLGDGRKLVAEAGIDPDYKEVYVYLADSHDVIIQDLAIIGENYRSANNADPDPDQNVIPIHGEYSVKVYADEQSEDWTFKHNIKLFDNGNDGIPFAATEDEEGDN